MSILLARGAIESGALALHDGADRCAADAAGLARTAVDSGFELEIARLALGAHKVPQAAAPLQYRAREHIDDGRMQAHSTWAGDLSGWQCRTDARQKQRLGGINVANPDNDVTGQKHLLDGRRALAQGRMESHSMESAIQRLHPQMPQQFLRLWRVFRRGPDHGTKTPGVMQPQRPPVCHKVHVVVHASLGLDRREIQTARHAQVQQQQALIQIEQQVLAPPANRPDLLAAQGLGLNTQWPAQGFAHAQHTDARTGNPVGKAQAGDFDFGQFRHGNSGSCGNGRKAGGLQTLDYHARMKSWLRIAVLSSCILTSGVQAATPSDKPAVPAAQSALDAVLFYQLLLGELNVRQGSPGAGFSLILDAARKTRDPALFQRAVDVALQARSGEAALQAAQTWKREIPLAPEPNRYILQILLALNRIDEAGQALASSIDELPVSEKQGAIISIPRVFARVSDKAQAARVVENALQRSLAQKGLEATAWTTIGRMRRDAQQMQQAIEAALKGHAADPQAQGPLILGLSLLPSGSADIRRMLDEAMRGPVSPEMRLSYARSLIALQAQSDALVQLQQLTGQHPAFSPGWLLQGLLQIDLGQPSQARQSLVQHVELVRNSQEAEQQAGLTEALMALSQLAQQQGELDQAARWLNQIPASADPVRLAIRRAEVLEQQGRPDEGRVVLSQVQPATAEQAKRKTLALSRWMREHRQAEQAYTLVQQALGPSADDVELLTELSMVTEKLKRYEEMEKLLRQLMRMRPQDPHAFNALGYSLADRGIRLEEARQLIQQAVQLAPQDPYIQDSLGWVEFRLNRPEEALRILRAAYQARPDAEIAAHLGEVLWSLGQRNEAARIWREGLLLKADNDTLLDTMRRLGFKP